MYKDYLYEELGDEYKNLGITDRAPDGDYHRRRV